MKLLFVRHGQTDWNKEKKLMGRSDVPLNEEGLQQCNELIKQLTPDFDIIFSSPLKRAFQTTQIISQNFDKEIIVKDELAERDFGSLSGKNWAQIEAETGVDMHSLTKEEKYDFRPYNGESADDVHMRIQHFLTWLRLQPYSCVVVVCHSGIISGMRYLYPNNELGHIANASINEFEL